MLFLTPPDAPPPSPSVRRRMLLFIALGGVGLALVVAVLVVLWSARPRLTEEAVRTTVLTTIQSESPEEFLVTGTLSSSVSAQGSRRWAVRALNIETGRSTVTVRVPGRMSYGFRLGDLRPEDIRFVDGGIVEIRLPELSVFGVEPLLDEAEVSADVEGVGRVSPGLTARTIQQTLRGITPALRQQAEGHLQTASQPRLNTARALRRMLATPLAAAGVEDIRFRFLLAPGDTLDLGADGRRRTVPIPPAAR